MCGRYVSASDKHRIVEASPREAPVSTFATPDDGLITSFPTIFTSRIVRGANRDSGERELVSARVGLIPFFTKRTWPR